MKKVLSLLLILFMCFALSACNSSQNAETTETTGYTVSEESSSTQQDENGDTEHMKVLVARQLTITIFTPCSPFISFHRNNRISYVICVFYLLLEFPLASLLTGLD